MAVSGLVSRHFHFGPFEVDEERRMVCRRGLPVHVRGQSFDLLVALLHRGGHVLTRGEARALLWPAGTYIEFDAAIDSIVNRLRQALGDSAAKSRYIETIPRHGYRFIWPREESPRRLVVLPFVDLGPGPRQERLCDGLTEEIIGQLARLGGERLSVLARTSSMHYKGTRMGAAAIACELGADFLLEGSVRSSGQRVRVSAQLIAAAGENHLWAETYECAAADVLRLQEQVALSVAGEVCRVLVPV